MIRRISGVLGVVVTALLIGAAPAMAVSPPSIPSATIHPSEGGTITAEIIPASRLSGARPDNAEGTNDDVTIAIEGSGLRIDNWEVIGEPIPPDLCTQGFFWLNGQIREQGPLLCNGGGEGIYVANWEGITLTNTAQACNTVAHIPGKPCEWVYSQN